MQYYLRGRFPLLHWITLLWGNTDVRVRLRVRIIEISLMSAYKHKHTLKIISPGLVKTLPRPHHMIKTLTRRKTSFTSTCCWDIQGVLNVSLYLETSASFIYIILDQQLCNEAQDAVLYFDVVLNNWVSHDSYEQGTDQSATRTRTIDFITYQGTKDKLHLCNWVSWRLLVDWCIFMEACFCHWIKNTAR